MLLDEFGRSYEAERSRAIKAEERGDAHNELTWPLDPLLEALLRFENELELRGLIDRVFRLCDANATGRVDCTKAPPAPPAPNKSRLHQDPPTYVRNRGCG